MTQALTILGPLIMARGQQANAESQAAVSRYNAQVAEQNAKIARQQAEREAKDTRRETQLRIGAQRASAAASGVLTSEGSPLLATLTQASEGEMAALERLYSGELQARGQESQARLDRLQSKAFKRQGRQALVAGAIGSASAMQQQAGTSLLG